MSNNEMIALTLSIYRYQPESDEKPRMQDYQLSIPKGGDMMVLAAIEKIKNEQDPTLGIRRSCAQGVCGSDGVNMNGINGLACMTHLSDVMGDGTRPIVIRPLPGFPVIRDLIVDMKQFYEQYERVKPYLQNDEPPPAKERLQTPEDRKKLDGLYECILCACCSSSCPSYWWNPDKFLGPAALLQANRFLSDSRDTSTDTRLEALDDPFSVYRCRTIGNCVRVCPKELNPTKAIGKIRQRMLERET